MTPIPPRLSETAFRRYEAWIGAAVNGSLPLTVTIPNLNGETISARLRDAAKGYSLYCYSSDLVDRQLFLSVWPTLEVSNQGDHAIIRRRGAGKQVAQSSPAGLTLRNMDGRLPSELIKAIACLLTYKLLTDRVEIIGWTEQELHELLDEDYDIAIFTEGHKIFII